MKEKLFEFWTSKELDALTEINILYCEINKFLQDQKL